MTTLQGNIAKGLRPGILHIFGYQYEQFDMMYSKIFRSIKSDKAFEEMLTLVGTTALTEKREADNIATDDIAQGLVVQIIPAVYAKMVIVSDELLKNYLYAPKIPEIIGMNLAKSKRDTIETVAHGVINNGFSTVSAGGMYNNPDGVALFSASHKLQKTGGTFSNIISADLSGAVVEQLCTQIVNWTDDAGIKLNIKPKKLLVPPALYYDAVRMLDSQLQPGGADNDVNALRTAEGLELLPRDPYLSDTDSYFILTSENDSQHGLVLVERDNIELSSQDGFDNMTQKFRLATWFGAGYGDPRCIAGSQGV